MPSEPKGQVEISPGNCPTAQRWPKVGQSGRGKSTFLKAFVDGAVPMGHRVVIVDLENEFGPLCQDLGGVFVDLQRGSDVRMNILDLNPQAADAPAQGLSVLKGCILAAVSRPLSDIEEGPVIHQAYVRVLQEAGIDHRDPQTWDRTPPRLSDFVLALRESQQRKEGEALAACLFAYTEGMYADDFEWFGVLWVTLPVGRRLRRAIRAPVTAAPLAPSQHKTPRPLKPRTPHDCPVCGQPHPTPPWGNSRKPGVLPWSERKSPRGQPKTICAAGYVCPNPNCDDYGNTDSTFHALAGDGKRSADQIQWLCC
jgi:hypothetical protein